MDSSAYHVILDIDGTRNNQHPSYADKIEIIKFL